MSKLLIWIIGSLSVVAWGTFTYFLPEIIYGYSYAKVIEGMNNPILNLIGDFRTKFIICIIISLILLGVITFLIILSIKRRRV